MNVLLLNDTSGSTNPGCKAAVAAIRDAYARVLSGVSFRSLPVGYFSQHFPPPTAAAPGAGTGETTFPGARADACHFDLAKWRSGCDVLAADPAFRKAGEWAELVIINGEGSIHHNYPRALALLAQAKVLADRGKRVHLVNATIQAMDRTLLAAVLPALALLHVREARSRGELEGVTSHASVTPDLAYAARFSPGVGAPPAPSDVGSAERVCLLTPGVLAHPRALAQQADAITAAGLRPVYFCVSDGGEARVAPGFCRERGIEFVDAASVPWDRILPFLRRFPVGVSGRHHVNIFLTMAGVPFVPLPSNTWKVEATLDLVRYPVPVCRTADALLVALRAVCDDLPGSAARSAVAGEVGTRAAQGFVDLLAGRNLAGLYTSVRNDETMHAI